MSISRTRDPWEPWNPIQATEGTTASRNDMTFNDSLRHCYTAWDALTLRDPVPLEPMLSCDSGYCSLDASPKGPEVNFYRGGLVFPPMTPYQSVHNNLPEISSTERVPYPLPESSTPARKAKRGGKRATRRLSKDAKLNASLVRKVGACASCRRRKVKVCILYTNLIARNVNI